MDPNSIFMKATVVKKELETYIPLLSKRQQEIILDMIKNILHVDAKEKRISVEQYNREIEEALIAVKKGRHVSHEEVVKRGSKWLKRH